MIQLGDLFLFFRSDNVVLSREFTVIDPEGNVFRQKGTKLGDNPKNFSELCLSTKETDPEAFARSLFSNPQISHVRYIPTDGVGKVFQR
jgi:hypothetical protein